MLLWQVRISPFLRFALPHRLTAFPFLRRRRRSRHLNLLHNEPQFNGLLAYRVQLLLTCSSSSIHFLAAIDEPLFIVAVFAFFFLLLLLIFFVVVLAFFILLLFLLTLLLKLRLELSCRVGCF